METCVVLIFGSVPLYLALPAELYGAAPLPIPSKHCMSTTECQPEPCFPVTAHQPAGCTQRCELDAQMEDGWRPYLLPPIAPARWVHPTVWTGCQNGEWMAPIPNVPPAQFGLK
uniref:Uncharacterized protein n=1 Tax=Eutreptiella gymnastica TaxID=73025 RepID=A0A7S1IUL0_9EUGL